MILQKKVDGISVYATTIKDYEIITSLSTKKITINVTYDNKDEQKSSYTLDPEDNYIYTISYDSGEDIRTVLHLH